MGDFSKLAYQALLRTQESPQEIESRKNTLYIGIPKETSFQEKRIPLTPLSVGLLVAHGHQVVIETDAGKDSNFLDHHYSEQGAQIVYGKEEVYKADIIIKIAAPTLDEVGLMKEGQVLLSGQQPSLMDLACLQGLMRKKITAISYEYLRDEDGSLTVVRAMSEIVGSTSVLIAAEYLSNVFDGKGLMLGGITGVPPTEMVILGAGTVGEFAAKTALALGAQVKVFDSSLHRLRRLKDNLSAPVFTSVIQPVVLKKAVLSSDVVIGAIRAENGRSPCLIDETTVSGMKPNSILIDISIDQGGCFETSEITNHANPVFRKYDVIHYCVPNVASRVARSATYALTNIFTPILIEIGDRGGLLNLIWAKPGVRNSVYLYQGHLTNKDMANRFGMTPKDLDLLVLSSQ